MPGVIFATQPTFVEPKASFEISEAMTQEIGNTVRGQKLEVIVSYTVVEKLKNFTVMRADHIFIKPNKRKVS